MIDHPNMLKNICLFLFLYSILSIFKHFWQTWKFSKWHPWVFIILYYLLYICIIITTDRWVYRLQREKSNTFCCIEKGKLNKKYKHNWKSYVALSLPLESKINKNQSKSPKAKAM